MRFAESSWPIARAARSASRDRAIAASPQKGHSNPFDGDFSLSIPAFGFANLNRSRRPLRQWRYGSVIEKCSTRKRGLV
jgi:hypothetical protein